MGQEENAAGITYEETKLDQALEEITGQRELGLRKRLRVTGKEKGEKAAADKHRLSAMDRLGQTVTRHFEHLIRISFVLCGLVVHSKHTSA